MEKINKEYPILSNWKFVFKEMYDLDHKYPWYIAVRSVAGFLAPFIAAIIPSAAISMVEKKADFLTFFGVMLAFVLGNMIMGNTATIFSTLGIIIDITPPLAVYGNDLQLKSDIDGIKVPLMYGGEEYIGLYICVYEDK